MSDQKNIDNLFREAFKDFEATPDPALWDKISSQLDEKTPPLKKRKEGIVFLPWFYKIAGIAAALLLLFAVGSQFFDNGEEVIDPTNETTSTTNENTNSNSTTTNSATHNGTNGTASDTQITGTENSTEEQRLQNENASQNTVLSEKERIANESKYNNTSNSEKDVQKNLEKGNALQNAVVTQDNGTNSNTISQQTLNTKNDVNGSNSIQTNTTISQENAVANKSSNSTNNKNAVATNGTKKVNNTTQNSLNTKNADYTTTVANNTKNTTKNNTSVAANGTKTNSNTTQNSTNTKNGDYSTTVAENTKNANVVTNGIKKGVNSSATAETNKTQETVHTNTTAVAQNETNNGTKTENSTNDTNATKEVDATKEAIAETTEKKDEIKKSLLDVINDLHALEKDSTVVAEANPRRWTISPNASPVYYNSLVNGSPISETFADNTKSGDVNLSFGINVGYDVSKRLTIRTGVHKVDYSYSTKDVALVPSINTGTGTITADGGVGANGISNDITTIAYSQNASTFSLTDKQVAINGEFTPTLLESSIRQAQIEGNLNQRMSYIEVPIELKYAVIDKKIGVNVIGGVSTLLLTENSIILDSPALTTELGEATNINDLSFSTNIGVGIDYKLSDQLEFNLEPMLKYQLNTFSGNTGNFKPYSVGVYTGVSFRF